MTLTQPQVSYLKKMENNMFTTGGCVPVPRVILNQLVKKELAVDTKKVFEFNIPNSSGQSIKMPVGYITLFGINVLNQHLASEPQQPES
jgi:hypothetical protein